MPGVLSFIAACVVGVTILLGAAYKLFHPNGWSYGILLFIVGGLFWLMAMTLGFVALFDMDFRRRYAFYGLVIAVIEWCVIGPGLPLMIRFFGR